MKRLIYFFGALGWGARLQMLVVLVILGLHAWLDYRKGYSVVTVFLFLTAWIIGWLLKPLMVAHPERTTRVWSFVSLLLLIVYFATSGQRWWRLLITRFTQEFLLWLDVSCGYWFHSELRIQQLRVERGGDEPRDAFGLGSDGFGPSPSDEPRNRF